MLVRSVSLILLLSVLRSRSLRAGTLRDIATVDLLGS